MKSEGEPSPEEQSSSGLFFTPDHSESQNSKVKSKKR